MFYTEVHNIETMATMCFNEYVVHGITTIFYIKVHDTEIDVMRSFLLHRVHGLCFILRFIV